MLLQNVKEVLGAELLTEDLDALSETEILTACGCDLMSDVLAFVKEQTLLLTGLINSQVIRTAEMMDIRAICFVRGKTPTEEVIDLANKKGIALLKTEESLYISCGKLYEQGIRGRSIA